MVSATKDVTKYTATFSDSIETTFLAISLSCLLALVSLEVDSYQEHRLVSAYQPLESVSVTALTALESPEPINSRVVVSGFMPSTKQPEPTWEEVKSIMQPVVVEEPPIQEVKQEPEPIQVAPVPVVSTPESSSKEIYQSYVDNICSGYSKYSNVRPEVVKTIIELESHYNPNATNGSAIGLAQIIPSYQKTRMQNLGVTDLYDPYSNILVCIDMLSEFTTQYGSEELALMLYSMRWDDAFALWNQGQTSRYVKLVYSMIEDQANG